MKRSLLRLMFALIPLTLAVGCGEVPPAETTNADTDRTSDQAALTNIIKCGGPDQLGCPDGQYCLHREGECSATSAGKCMPKPDICTKEYAPVCGCDGNTYGNGCMLAAAGVTLVHKGECKPGCVSDAQCSTGQFCDTPCDKDSGSCTAVIPAKLCPRIFKPVCGCDGKTYGNDCLRQAAKVGLAHIGQCKALCGGIAGFVCPKGYSCAYPPGTCNISDNMGECVPTPSACTDVWMPVCGCDGKTYGNKCEALLAGATIDHEGECKTICGGIAGFQCPKGQLCIFPPGTCNIVDNLGECVPAPQGCPDIWKPVCGCDGKTYSNECDATAAGVSISHDGECTTACGGIAGLPCPKGQACIFPPGTCNISDNMGQCKPMPQMCPLFWAPVCGCDGKTYGNECEALAVGMSIAHLGQCKNICGGIAGFPCPEGQICMFPPGTCNISDNMGQCITPPQACPDVWSPVCGCDGKTYGNECEALAAGMPIDHDGECKSNCDLIKCLPGQIAVDTDGDGCNDTCLCGFVIDCIPGWVPKDSNGDGCADTCVPTCENTCDCYASGAEFQNGCFLKCMNCGNFWSCEEGVCVEHCGFMPPEVFQCKECKDNSQCGPDQFCQKDQGACDGIGQCVAKPELCNDLWAPVCGCDGQTYSNHCDAAGAGVNVAYEGECKPAGCKSNAECADNEYCHTAPGACGSMGVCAPKPQGCILIYDPVCGCDGKTYGNACEAAASGMNVSYKGECKPDGCVDNFQCPNGYCYKQVGDCVGSGICAPKPQACTLIYDPVCGCDGKTYGNACSAASAGMNIAYQGECIPPSDGCKSDLECAKGQFCHKAPGDCDGLGKCAPKPDACIALYDPVCGCNGKTYSNACVAAANGINVASKGECEPPCDPIQCTSEQVAIDADGDGCNDTCECAIAIKCAAGFIPTDTNGDGCFDACKPLCQKLVCSDEQTPIDADGDGCNDTCICAFAIKCAPGFISVDTNGDGCHDFCKPLCKDLLCTTEQVGIDTDGDGCNDFCECAVAILCAPGFLPIDTNGDGCMDSCKPICPKLECSPEQVAVDADGNGCPDTCKCKTQIVCKPGHKPVDTNGDGCIDHCIPSCLEILCTTEQNAVDTNNDGCPDTCMCKIAIDCLPGYKPTDTNGDGCIDKCIQFCKELLCTTEQAAVDTNNDGCPDTCMCKLAIDCAPGFKPTDTNGDGCIDKCVPSCVELQCSPEKKPADTNNDGCPDICKCAAIISCAPGTKPADSNGDGCADTCVPACPELLCPTGTKPIDTNNDGCPDKCLAP